MRRKLHLGVPESRVSYLGSTLGLPLLSPFFISCLCVGLPRRRDRNRTNMAFVQEAKLFLGLDLNTGLYPAN